MARKGYVQLANGFYMNRKVRKLRATCPSAVGAFVMLLAYCGDNLTDGFVDAETSQYVLQISSEELDALCDAGMLERLEDGSGYAIHDYLNHNRSREQVMRKRDREKERYHAATSQTEDSADILPAENQLNRDKHQNTRTPEHQNNKHSSSIPLPLSPKREKGKRKRKTKPELPSDAWLTDHLLLKLPDEADPITARRKLYRLIHDGVSPDEAAQQVIAEMTTQETGNGHTRQQRKETEQ